MVIHTGALGVGATIASSPLGTIQSGGSVRASKGLTVLDNDDTGFSFAGDGNTGLFAVNGFFFPRLLFIVFLFFFSLSFHSFVM